MEKKVGDYMLNIKQEKFIQNIINGMSQRQAYKEAFDADYDDDAIDSNASTLFNSTKVQQRYQELMKELEEAQKNNTDFYVPSDYYIDENLAKKISGLFEIPEETEIDIYVKQM